MPMCFNYIVIRDDEVLSRLSVERNRSLFCQSGKHLAAVTTRCDSLSPNNGQAHVGYTTLGLNVRSPFTAFTALGHETT